MPWLPRGATVNPKIAQGLLSGRSSERWQNVVTATPSAAEPGSRFLRLPVRRSRDAPTTRHPR